MITIGVAQTLNELQQILALQARNHVSNISAEVKNKEGFVTVKHNLELLTAMNQEAKQVIAREGNQVVGYALVMLKSFQTMIPVLVPMLKCLKKFYIWANRYQNIHIM